MFKKTVVSGHNMRVVMSFRKLALKLIKDTISLRIGPLPFS